MKLTINQMKQVVAAGGNLIVDGASITLSQLKSIAAEAAKSNVLITIKNIQILSHEQLKEVAALAPGQIFFDFYD